ncbi:MAG: hypothetical protein AAF206_15420, partial [Bacteroidota bacterium]
MQLRYFFFIVLCFTSTALWGQLPPNQPEQDCINALPVCQSIFTQQNSYQGEGQDPNEISSNISCLGAGELNDVWYIFTVQTTGMLSFVINPNNNFDDYDWAVYDLTNANCSDIATNGNLEVSCNFSGVTGPTGVQNTPGSQFEPTFTVNAGETYVVNVSNFSSTSSGYTLDFSMSTAAIFDSIPPVMTMLSIDCGSTDINIPFSENVLCSTVEPTDFTITGPGGPYTVTAITGTACTNGGTFENDFIMTTVPPITQTGTYTVSVVDTILDNCGNVAQFTSENVFVSIQGITATASPDTICVGEQTTLSSSVASSPGYTFVWMPIGSTSPNPVVSPLNTTVYTVEATDANGCISIASVEVFVKPTPTSNFTAPADICDNQFATLLYTGTGGPGSIYQWDFDGGTALGSGQGPYAVSWTTPGPKDVSLTVISGGCASTMTTQTINVIEIPTAQFNGPAQVCVDDTAFYTYTGNIGNQAFFAWTFPGATYVENVGPPGTIGPYKVVWGSSGIRSVCLQVDNQGCPSSLNCQDINVMPLPVADISPVADQCFTGNSFDFVYTGDANVATYSWFFGVDANPAVSTDPVPPTVTYSNPGVKTVSLIVTRNGCVSDSAKVTFEVIPEPSADFNASTGATCQDTCVTFNFTGIVAGTG